MTDTSAAPEDESPSGFSVHPTWLDEPPKPKWSLEKEYDDLYDEICRHLIWQRRLDSSAAGDVENLLGQLRSAVRRVHNKVGAGLSLRVHVYHNDGAAS